MPHYLLPLLIAFGILAAILPAVLSLAKTGDSRSRYVSKALLTANEKEFFLRLCKALPDYHVLAQVSMGQLITTRKLRGDRSNEHLRARNRFSQKAVDFVIADSDLNVVALVELDDRTHHAERDRRRDEMTRSAGYATLRYASREKPTPWQIARDVRNLRNP